MEYKNAFEIVRDLDFDTKFIFHEEGGWQVYLYRPGTLPKRFKNYNLEKNFQIFLKEGEREFRPNHLRIMIDLHLRVRSKPNLKNEILLAFDKIFYREDPITVIDELKKSDFEHYLNPIGIIASLSQLFIIEQDYNYNKESKFEPPTLFYQGWVRQFIDSSKEIDNLCMSVCNGQPPAAKYTYLENKKHKKYNSNHGELWYVSE